VPLVYLAWRSIASGLGVCDRYVVQGCCARHMKMCCLILPWHDEDGSRTVLCLEYEQLQVGWYHSHPHITCLPSHVDVRTQA
jgi:hypothetical protein